MILEPRCNSLSFFLPAVDDHGDDDDNDDDCDYNGDDADDNDDDDGSIKCFSTSSKPHQTRITLFSVKMEKHKELWGETRSVLIHCTARIIHSIMFMQS